MSNSYITEKALADSLKKLMLSRSINKITVKEVTDQCNVNRRTFYNHFNDTYELLGWIYEHEVIEELEQYYNLEGWKTAVRRVLSYTLDNKIICLNTFNSLGREHLEKFLYDIFCNAFRGVIEDLTKEMNIEKEVKEEVARFFTIAIVGEFIIWLRNGLKEDPESILERIDIMMSGTLYGILSKHNKNL